MRTTKCLTKDDIRKVMITDLYGLGNMTTAHFNFYVCGLKVKNKDAVKKALELGIKNIYGVWKGDL